MGEPGVRPNTGAIIPGAGGQNTNLSDIRNRSKLVNAFGNTASQTVDPRGYALQIAAPPVSPCLFTA